MKNVIYIHAGNLNIDKANYPNKYRCQNILNEIALYILDSGLINDVDQINVELIGDPDIYFKCPKSKITINNSDPHKWEFPTLNKVIEHSKNNPDDNILYLHTRGSSRNIMGLGIPENHITWIEDNRNYHLYQNITRYKECLEFLNSYDACGAELINTPVTHYSMNFWWAKASHINTLIDPNDLPIVLDERHKCEFWICSNPNGKYKSIFNLYNQWWDAPSFAKELYIGKK